MKFETRCKIKFRISRVLNENDLDEPMTSLARALRDCLVHHTNLSEQSAEKLAKAWLCHTEIEKGDVKIISRNW